MAAPYCACTLSESVGTGDQQFESCFLQRRVKRTSNHVECSIRPRRNRHPRIAGRLRSPGMETPTSASGSQAGSYLVGLTPIPMDEVLQLTASTGRRRLDHGRIVAEGTAVALRQGPAAAPRRTRSSRPRMQRRRKPVPGTILNLFAVSPCSLLAARCIRPHSRRHRKTRFARGCSQTRFTPVKLPTRAISTPGSIRR